MFVGHPVFSMPEERVLRLLQIYREGKGKRGACSFLRFTFARKCDIMTPNDYVEEHYAVDDFFDQACIQSV